MKSGKLHNEILNLINNASFDSAIKLIRHGFARNLFDSDLYYYMGLTYKHKKNYDCAYHCN